MFCHSFSRACVGDCRLSLFNFDNNTDYDKTAQMIVSLSLIADRISHGLHCLLLG